MFLYKDSISLKNVVLHAHSLNISTCIAYESVNIFLIFITKYKLINRTFLNVVECWYISN